LGTPAKNIVKVGIVSDAHHYRDRTGALVALAPLVRQFEQWALLFNEIVVCAPLVSGPPPATHVPYRASNIRLLPVRRAGGRGIRAKLQLASCVPHWWKALGDLFATVDAVHIRCPNNISILGLLRLWRSGIRAQAVFTGSWGDYPSEPLTYKIQRVWLREYFSGPVAAYTSSPENARIIPSFSPAFSDCEWLDATSHVEERLQTLRGLSSLPSVNLITVGTLDRNKNQRVALIVTALLAQRGVDVRLKVVGAGPESSTLAAQAEELRVRERVSFVGRVGKTDLAAHYRWAHVLIQSPLMEGFGKVPLEAMCYGVIPILSRQPAHAAFASEGRGYLFDVSVPPQAADAVMQVLNDPRSAAEMISAGRIFARTMSLESWGRHLEAMLTQYWQIERTEIQAR
jgi:glycosyltransferase involved in cell wall biosynthesis